MNELLQVEFRELPEVPSIPVYESTTKAVADGKLTPMAMAVHTFIRGLNSWSIRTTGKKWKIYAEDLAKRMGVTRKTISKYLNQLVDGGYMDRHRNGKGQAALFGGYTYICYCMHKDEWVKCISSLNRG